MMYQRLVLVLKVDHLFIGIINSYKEDSVSAAVQALFGLIFGGVLNEKVLNRLCVSPKPQKNKLTALRVQNASS